MNRGAERFRTWRLNKGIPQRIVGERLEVATNSVTMFETGARVPGLARAVQIEKLTDGFVRAEHWLQPAKTSVAA